MVLYFSATGNTKLIAEALAEELGDECDRNEGQKACMGFGSLRSLYVLYPELSRQSNRI